MRQPVVLITGAAGEIGHALIERLSEHSGIPVITLDLTPLDEALARRVSREFSGSILDRNLLQTIHAEFEVDRIYHLAALLSTRSEFSPVQAHDVNVTGTLHLLEFAMEEARSHGQPVMFFYPSSIAAYGIKPGDEQADRPLLESELNCPTTMYGCNKLYCEHLGSYYASHYKQLDAEDYSGKVDFRCIRFPGLISALTVPSGGTSDYAPEMIHAAAQSRPYACFVRPDTRIPFMTMPDAVDSIFALTEAPTDKLTQCVYNVSAFNPTAERIEKLVREAYPSAEITYEPDPRRQAIVDSWPRAVDDQAARGDWGLAPKHDLESAFADYLIPTIAQRYAVV
jgi:nucleoside-diphosphate-sugar epimerase